MRHRRSSGQHRLIRSAPSRPEDVAVSLQAQSNGEERESRDSPAFRRYLLPVWLHLVRHPRRFSMLAPCFVRRLLCRLPCAVPLLCCLCVWWGCTCRVSSSASGASQQNSSKACPRWASVVRFSPRREVALLVLVLACVGHVLSRCTPCNSLRVALSSRVCFRGSAHVAVVSRVTFVLNLS